MYWLLGGLVLGQALVSFAAVRRWREFMRRYRRRSDFAPPASVIVPCRGNEPGLAENLAAYARQQYPDFELLLITSDAEDPASAIAAAVCAAASNARMLHAAPRPDEGEKVTKLRAAAAEARRESQVLVFADSDGRPHPGWLGELVAPLEAAESEAGATTGYRWYVPASGRLAPAARAAWNSFIASLLGEHRRNFCWGGAMAIRRRTFEKLQVDRYWRGAVSDDYQMTRALNEAGLPIRFVPTCLVPNHSDCGWRELFSWTTRQIVITRIYAPRLWKLGLAANGFYCAGVAALAARLPSWPAAALVAAIALVSMSTGLARAQGAAAALPHPREPGGLPAGPADLRPRALVLLAPLVPFLMLYNFTAAGLTRVICWRGTRYRIEGPQRVTASRL